MTNNINHSTEDTVSKKTIDDGMVSITAKIPVYVKEAIAIQRDSPGAKLTNGEVIEVWYNAIVTVQKSLKERDETILNLSTQNSELLQKLKDEDTVWEKKTK
jgi:uncharacterized protein YjcR